MSLSPRVICSTITLRHLPLGAALREIAERGFAGIDLGALPGVCDHVPYDLTPAAVAEVASTILDSGLSVVSVNGDIGDLNVPMDAAGAAARAAHADLLLDLAARVGARALVLPNGRLDHAPVRDLESDLDLVAAGGPLAATLAEQGVALIGWREIRDLMRSGPVGRTA